MNVPAMSRLRAVGALLLLAAAGPSFAQEGGPGTTRLLVSVVRVKPELVDEWLALEKNEVVPALKKAGIKERTVYRTLIGEASEFVEVRPLASFAEFDGPNPLERALGARAAGELLAKLRRCTQSIHRSIENSRDDFYLDPGDAQALFVSRYRALPGKSQAYMSFVGTEMMPVMRRAQEDGTFAGLSVTVSGHGGEWGLITLNMFYRDFAPLDGPPPVAKTLGPEGTREFLAKGAGLITPIEWIVRERIADLSFRM